MSSAIPCPWDRVISQLPAASCLCCGGGWLCCHLSTSHCDTTTPSACHTVSTNRLAKCRVNPFLVCGLSIFVETKPIPGPEVDARHLSAPVHNLFPQDSAKLLLTKTSPCHLTHPLPALLPSSTTDHMHICMRKRLSAASHHSTLPGDEQSVEADRLCHIRVWHFMHIRYAPPSGSCSHAKCECVTPNMWLLASVYWTLTRSYTPT